LVPSGRAGGGGTAEVVCGAAAEVTADSDVVASVFVPLPQPTMAKLSAAAHKPAVAVTNAFLMELLLLAARQCAGCNWSPYPWHRPKHLVE
jgi:hypothetical protein